jgi:hypothetical protein
LRNSFPIVARILAAAVCVTLVAARPALCQGTNPRRPSGGLFGGGSFGSDSNERLNFTFEVAEGYDSQLPLEREVAIVGGDLSSGGFSTVFGGTASFGQGGRRFQFGASASTAFKYYQQLNRLDALSHGAGFGIGVGLPNRGRFEINEALAYSPSYLYQLFPQSDPPALGESIPLNPDYRIDQAGSYSSTTRAALEYGSSRETLFTTSAEYRVTEYQDETTVLSGVETRSVGASVSHAMSRSFSFSGGYNYRTGTVGLTGPSYEHETPIRVQYSRALSPTRRLSIRVHVSPAWSKIAPSDLVVATDEPVRDQFFRMNGGASVSYPFKLNWNAQATYSRSIQYVMGLTEPLLSDSIGVGLSGLMSRRIELTAAGGYASAMSAPSGSRQQLDTYTAGARITYAFRRSMAVYSEYLYYYYDQAGVLRLAPGLPRVFEQHGVRVGFSLFAEALGRRRGI